MSALIEAIAYLKGLLRQTKNERIRGELSEQVAALQGALAECEAAAARFADMAKLCKAFNECCTEAQPARAELLEILGLPETAPDAEVFEMAVVVYRALAPEGGDSSGT